MSSRSAPKLPPPRSDGGVSIAAFGMLAFLLVPPVYALSRLTAQVDWKLLVGVPLVLSALTFFVYRSDKRRAEAA